jgi:RNA polymerase sigma-70 factor (ECF subfamily)
VKEGDAGQISSSDRDPYEKVTNKEMMKRIQECIDALPLQQQQVIRLREMEGFSYNEIAQVLDLTLDQVKVSLFRGRNAIRKTITKEEESWKKQR